jgi:hypothetical protein
VPQGAPVAVRGLQQHRGSHHVGLDENVRIGDRAVDVRFGRKMKHRRRTIRAEDALDLRGGADVDALETVPRVSLHFREARGIGGISERVDIDNVHPALANQMAKDRRSDKARASGHDYDVIAHVSPNTAPKERSTGIPRRLRYPRTL